MWLHPTLIAGHARSHTNTHTHTAYHQLMLHTDTNEENLSGFLKLLDMALQHEVSRAVQPVVRWGLQVLCKNHGCSVGWQCSRL